MIKLQKPKFIMSDIISCSCDNGIITCPGCGGGQSKHGVCAGCKGSGIRICGKCGGKNKIYRFGVYEAPYHKTSKIMMKYRQTTTIISCNNNKELTEKVNRLGAAGDMPITIKPTIPEATDTKQWYAVNYWVME